MLTITFINKEEYTIDYSGDKIFDSGTAASTDNNLKTVKYQPSGDPSIDFYEHAILVCQAKYDISSYNLNNNVLTIEVSQELSERDIDYIASVINIFKETYEYQNPNLIIDITNN